MPKQLRGPASTAGLGFSIWTTHWDSSGGKCHKLLIILPFFVVTFLEVVIKLYWIFAKIPSFSGKGGKLLCSK
jgi:hypothetical protein